MGRVHYAGVAIAVASSAVSASFASANELSMKQFALGMNALASNSNDDALDHFNRAMIADPKSADGILGRAVYYRKTGELVLARKDIEAAIVLQPQRATVWQTSAEISLQARDYPRALRDAAKAIELNDQATVAYYTRGVARRELDQSEEALKDLDVAVQRQPNLPRPYLERAKVYHRLGRQAEGDADLRRASELASAGTNVATDIETYRKVAAERPQGAVVSENSGVADKSDRVGGLDLAAERKAIASVPETADGVRTLGEIASRLGKIAWQMSTEETLETQRLNVPNPVPDSYFMGSKAIEGVQKLAEARRQDLSAKLAKKAQDANVSDFAAKADEAVLEHDADVAKLNLTPEVADSRIVLRGLILGMQPTPWITLRQWVALVMDRGEYRIVDVRKSDDGAVWGFVLKKPAQPTMTLTFRYDYGDLFSHALGFGDKMQDINSPGDLSAFDRLMAAAVGFSHEELLKGQ